jgi:TolB-like protein/DNA-binding winged helix-turn-helix (wHTH) protein
VKFGHHRFDPRSGRLWSGKREVRLTPKAAAVLAVLVERAGQPITRREVSASVWGDTVVSDDALTSCIQELRKALDDDARHPRFIETRHRRGYRFVARLQEPESGEAAARNRSDGRGREPAPAPLDAGGAAADDREREPTVAVLPFDNLSGDPGQEYFSDGITEDLITALAKYRSLLVVGRGSTFAFRGRGEDVRRVGAELGADYVVEGSVGRAGGRVRVRARLVETEGGRHLWAEQYDRDIERIFEVQDEITATVAARIEPEVGTAERLRAERKPPQDLRAWDFFHLGTKQFYQSSVEANREAQRLFRHAIELDPTLAGAHAWLAYSAIVSMVYFDAEPDEERLGEAAGIARRGVELDERDAFTHFVHGRALLTRKDYPNALAEAESAVELNPLMAIAHCGLADSLSYEGRFDEAIPHFQRSIDLSPHDPQRWAFQSYRALAHLAAGQLDEALDWSQKAIRVPFCHYWPYAHRVSALGHLGRVEEYEAAIGELRQRAPRFTCGFARRRLFYVKDPAHVELYVEGLRKAGVGE